MMFSLMSFFFVVNLAVMMRELTGSQPMSAACAYGVNSRATPSVGGVAGGGGGGGVRWGGGGSLLDVS